MNARNLSSSFARNEPWLAIAIGNSRVLWGRFVNLELQVWGRAALTPESEPGAELERHLRDVGNRVWLAGVGNFNSALATWPDLARARQLELDDVPLQHPYPTLGIDRALAVVGAAQNIGWPALVVDAGTALTFTAVDETGAFAGGAIAPGMRLQGRSLHAATAALPAWDEAEMVQWPRVRWADSTASAMQSGVVYGAIATVQSFCLDWRARYPNHAIAFTGGDGEFLHRAAHLPQSYFDPTLVLKGMAACY